jgi:glycosyltransferase involved in cell wall biosynthesis
MRILYVTDSYPPNISGAAQFTASLANAMADRGHTVAVLIPDKRFGVEQQGSVTIVRAPSLPNPWRPGFRISSSSSRRVRLWVADFCPDIIHLQSPWGMARLAARYAKKNQTPLIGTVHFSFKYVASYLPFGQKLAPTYRPVVATIIRQLFKQCDILTCPSETLRRELREDKFYQNQIEVISNGINYERFAQASSLPRPPLYRSDDPLLPIILSVGRLDQDKNTSLLLKAIPLVIAQKPAIFYLVGAGTKRNSYKRWVAMHGLQEWVRFPGAIPHNDPTFPALYGHASLFVIASAIETQSLVTMEAMAAGLPVVAANGGALPELVQAGENGWLVSPEEPEEMAEAILAALDNQERAKAYGRRSQAIVYHHRQEESLRKFEELYQQNSGI